MIGPVLVVVLAAPGFQPLCGSFGAGGGQFDDTCGPCSEASAARWSPAQVTFTFDRATVPDALGVDATRFAADIDVSIAAWNAIPSSTLVVTDGGDAPERVWSDTSIDADHVVFWAVDDTEWSDDTGTAPNGGALGITTHGYLCDGNGGRLPYQDSDIILNGTQGLTSVVPSYNGRCFGLLVCPSSTTVLMHEMGHALGLGHPCPECQDSLMSAKAVINEVEPLPDDAESILALYGTSGALGVPCSGNGDCTSGHCGSFSMPSETLSYCTQPCGSCPSGFVCNAQSTCELASAVAAQLPAAGEPCFRACDNDCLVLGGSGVFHSGCNACIEAQDGSATCTHACDKSTGAGCDATTEFCSGVGTPDDQGICKPKKAEGGACADDTFCLAGLSCTANICRTACDPANPTACAQGQVCQDAGGGSFICKGGLEGDHCAVATDCATGFACTGGFCFENCLNDAGCVVAGETCSTSTATCVRVRAVGEKCGDFNDECAAASTCVSGLCTRACDASTGAGCNAGEQCETVAGAGLCFTAGAAASGAGCTTTADCQSELLCDAGLCRDRCDLGLPCPFGDTCTALDTGSACIPPPPSGEGEGEGAAEGEGAGEGEGERPRGVDPACACASSDAPASRGSALAGLLALVAGSVVVAPRGRRRSCSTRGVAAVSGRAL